MMYFLYFQSVESIQDPGLSSTLAFLTAMITPALLISASGTLVLSTSTRLGRVIDRSRSLESRLNELMASENKNETVLYFRRIEAVFDLLDKVTTRSRILQNALFLFYCSLALFVLTSLVIGVVGLFDAYEWLPIPVGMVGILFVFYGSVQMMREARMATSTTNAEMDITWEIATKIAPKEIVDKYSYNRYGNHLFNRRKNQ
ncbi:MAG: DUF2721 domain-containing protein [Pyrinomonadaceae bacterium]|nr:DUF2721 domain-containing protein [Pyrinomonadaceae bacterium]